MIWIFLILGDLDITWYHWPCNIDITKYQFYMAARIDKIVISEFPATDPPIWSDDSRRHCAPHITPTSVDQKNVLPEINFG